LRRDDKPHAHDLRGSRAFTSDQEEPSVGFDS
jgi:hypothetical protein